MHVAEKAIYIAIVVWIVILSVPLKATTLKCEQATVKATEIYLEFMEGKRTWKSTIKYDKRMKEVCNG